MQHINAVDRLKNNKQVNTEEKKNLFHLNRIEVIESTQETASACHLL